MIPRITQEPILYFFGCAFAIEWLICEPEEASRTMNLSIVRAVALVFWASTAIAGPAEEGQAAAMRGDFPAAIRIWRPLAEAGDAIAQHNLGFVYQNGQGVPPDQAEAVRWLSLAVAQGYGPAQNNLGVAYLTGQGVQRDEREAMRLFRLAVAQGWAAAEYNVGVIYQEGRGVPRDEWTAARWYRLAAGQGYAPAQYALGLMYSSGRGAPRDQSAALQWFRSAADQSHAGAQYNMGLMYAEGRGVDRDLVQAYVWLTLATSNGALALARDAHDRATEARDRMRAMLTEEQIAQSQRLVLNRQRAASGSALAFVPNSLLELRRDCSSQENRC